MTKISTHNATTRHSQSTDSSQRNRKDIEAIQVIQKSPKDKQYKLINEFFIKKYPFIKFILRKIFHQITSTTYVSIDDLDQEAFFCFRNCVEKFNTNLNTSFNGYLKTVLIRNVNNLLKRTSRTHTANIDEIEWLEDPRSNKSTDQVDSREALDHIQRMIEQSQFAPKQRTYWDLRFMGEQSVQEIAEQYGVQGAGVSELIRQGRKKLIETMINHTVLLKRTSPNSTTLLDLYPNNLPAHAKKTQTSI